MQGELAKCNEVRRKSIYTEIKKGTILGSDWKHVKMFNFLKNSLLLTENIQKLRMSSNTDNKGCVELIKPRDTAKSAHQHIGPHVKVFAWARHLKKNVILCLIMTGVACVRRNVLITDFFRQIIFDQSTKSAPGYFKAMLKIFRKVVSSF